jgi:hypothetical protein
MFRLFLIEIAMIFPLALGGYSLFSGGVLFFGGHIISLLIVVCLYGIVTAILSPTPSTLYSYPFPPAPPAPPAPSRPTRPVKRRQKPQYRGFIFLPLFGVDAELIADVIEGLLTNPSLKTPVYVILLTVLGLVYSDDEEPPSNLVGRLIDYVWSLVEDFFKTTLTSTPLLVEGLLFVLICFIITIISVSMDEEDSEGALSFLS